jgi:hypothetical protein
MKSCECGYETFGPVKDMEFLDQLLTINIKRKTLLHRIIYYELILWVTYKVKKDVTSAKEIYHFPSLSFSFSIRLIGPNISLNQRHHFDDGSDKNSIHQSLKTLKCFTEEEGRLFVSLCLFGC